MTTETGMCELHKVSHCVMYYLGLTLEEIIFWLYKCHSGSHQVCMNGCHDSNSFAYTQ